MNVFDESAVRTYCASKRLADADVATVVRVLGAIAAHVNGTGAGMHYKLDTSGHAAGPFALHMKQVAAPTLAYARAIADASARVLAVAFVPAAPTGGGTL